MTRRRKPSPVRKPTPAESGAKPTPESGGEDPPILFLHGDRPALSPGRRHARDPQGRRACGLARTIGGAGGALRRRQIDAAAHRRPARAAGCGRGLYRPGGDLAPVGRRAHPHPPHRDRLRLPVPSPADGILRDRERDHAADDPRPVARRGQPPRDRSAQLSRPQGAFHASAGASSPAASSSGSRSRARSPMRRASCWPTSRPETSIRARPTTCSRR